MVPVAPDDDLQAATREPLRPFIRALVLVMTLTLTTVAFFFTAWLGEDAYIDFRVVSNVVSGFGPVWNVGERVQVFTSPAWIGLLALVSKLSGLDSPGTALVVSLCCDCIVTVAIVYVGLGRPLLLAVALFCLFGSQAYLDYSSSGLENPLVHAVLTLAGLLLCRAQEGCTAKTWLAMSLVCSVALCTRLDAILLVLPVWLFVGTCRARQAGLRSTFVTAAVGALPWFAWETFSLLYYGSFVPNTAWAKLPPGYPTRDLLVKGLVLIRATAVADPGTLLSILLAPIVLLACRSKLALVSAAASVGSLVGIVWIGGDFMQGRFLTGIFVLSWLLLLIGVAASNWSFATRRAAPRQFALVTAALVLTVAATAFSAVRQFRAGKFGLDYGPQPLYLAQVADERSYYNRVSSLRAMMVGRISPWVDEGLWIRSELGPRKALVAKRNVGMFAYAAGPSVFVVDLLSLGNPFSSRLPSCPSNRAGHFFRPLPAGYASSLVKGTNRVKDPFLARLFDDVLLVTRAPLTSFRRLGAIWRLQSGTYRNVEQLRHYTTQPKGVFNFGFDRGDEHVVCPSVSNGARTDVLAMTEANEATPPWLTLSAR